MVPTREIEMRPLGAFKEGVQEGRRQAKTCFGRVFCCLSSGESAPLRPNGDHTSIQAAEEKSCLEKTALACGYCCTCVLMPCCLASELYADCQVGRNWFYFSRTRRFCIVTRNALAAATLCSPLWGTGLWLTQSGTNLELGECLFGFGCAAPCLMEGYALYRFCLCPCCFDEDREAWGSSGC